MKELLRPGEWSTFIGNSHSYTVAVTLASTPHRCYVQKALWACLPLVFDGFRMDFASSERLLTVRNAARTSSSCATAVTACSQVAFKACSYRL